MDAPPLLVSYQSLSRLLKACEMDENGKEWHSISYLTHQRLPPVVSKSSLAVLFGYSPTFLGSLYLYTDRYYRTFYIIKGKKKRRIDAPKVALKVIQKWAGHHLAQSLDFDSCVVGFVPGRSSIEGASRHCGSNWIFSTDIEDFFPTTSQTNVFSALCELGYTVHGADLLATLTCLNGNLAQGSPCSPVLSNLCFRPFDKKISDYATKEGFTYTRYADDIVISGKGDPPSDIQELIIDIVNQGGWKISLKKTFVSRAPHRLKVYGLLVHGDRVRLTKGYRNRIRAIAHLKKFDKLDPTRLPVANGHLAYAQSVAKHSSPQQSETSEYRRLRLD